MARATYIVLLCVAAVALTSAQFSTTDVWTGPECVTDRLTDQTCRGAGVTIPSPKGKAAVWYAYPEGDGPNGGYPGDTIDQALAKCAGAFVNVCQIRLSQGVYRELISISSSDYNGDLQGKTIHFVGTSSTDGNAYADQHDVSFFGRPFPNQDPNSLDAIFTLNGDMKGKSTAVIFDHISIYEGAAHGIVARGNLNLYLAHVNIFQMGGSAVHASNNFLEIKYSVIDEVARTTGFSGSCPSLAEGYIGSFSRDAPAVYVNDDVRFSVSYSTFSNNGGVAILSRSSASISRNVFWGNQRFHVLLDDSDMFATRDYQVNYNWMFPGGSTAAGIGLSGYGFTTANDFDITGNLINSQCGAMYVFYGVGNFFNYFGCETTTDEEPIIITDDLCTNLGDSGTTGVNSIYRKYWFNTHMYLGGSGEGCVLSFTPAPQVVPSPVPGVFSPVPTPYFDPNIMTETPANIPSFTPVPTPTPTPTPSPSPTPILYNPVQSQFSFNTFMNYNGASVACFDSELPFDGSQAAVHQSFAYNYLFEEDESATGTCVQGPPLKNRGRCRGVTNINFIFNIKIEEDYCPWYFIPSNYSVGRSRENEYENLCNQMTDGDLEDPNYDSGYFGNPRCFGYGIVRGVVRYNSLYWAFAQEWPVGYIPRFEYNRFRSMCIPIQFNPTNEVPAPPPRFLSNDNVFSSDAGTLAVSTASLAVFAIAALNF